MTISGKTTGFPHPCAGIEKKLLALEPRYSMESKVDETAVLGDGENDIDMLEFVQTGIAMVNAHDKVKKHADFVTSPVDSNGIEAALSVPPIVKSERSQVLFHISRGA